MTFDLKEYLKQKKGLVDGFLDKAAPKSDIIPASLHRSMRYSLEAGGKRVRPVLAIAAAARNEHPTLLRITDGVGHEVAHDALEQYAVGART